MITRFDIPEIVRHMFDKAVEIKLIDLYDVMVIASNNLNDIDGMVNELVEIAYTMIHSEPRSHPLMCAYLEQYMILKNCEVK